MISNYHYLKQIFLSAHFLIGVQWLGTNCQMKHVRWGILLALKGYSTPYFDFCSKCSICTIKTYERQKEREKENLTAENCTRKAKFPPIRRPEVKLTIFGHVISDVERRTRLGPLLVYHKGS